VRAQVGSGRWIGREDGGTRLAGFGLVLDGWLEYNLKMAMQDTLFVDHDVPAGDQLPKNIVPESFLTFPAQLHRIKKDKSGR